MCVPHEMHPTRCGIRYPRAAHRERWTVSVAVWNAVICIAAALGLPCLRAARGQLNPLVPLMRATSLHPIPSRTPGDPAAREQSLTGGYARAGGRTGSVLQSIPIPDPPVSACPPSRTKWKRQTAVGLELLAEAGNYSALQRMFPSPYFYPQSLVSNLDPGAALYLYRGPSAPPPALQRPLVPRILIHGLQGGSEPPPPLPPLPGVLPRAAQPR